MWYFNFLERHGHEPDVQEMLVEDFDHRLCSNGKVVVECLHDRRRIKRRIGYMLARFPCSACSKNKWNKRWADYKARDLISAEKRRIVKEDITNFQDECRERRKRDEEFWRLVKQIRSVLQD